MRGSFTRGGRMIKLSPVSIGSIRRWRVPPYFDFVEEAIATGRAYAWGEEGYVLVAGKTSLLPEFVVEIRNANRPWVDTRALIEAICQVSCGAIWFDSCDHDAFDLVRRSGRTASASALLFAGGELALPSKLGEQLEIRLCGAGEMNVATELISSSALEIGGTLAVEARGMISRGEVWGGFQDDQLLAVAIVRRQDEIWSAIGLIVTSDKGRASRVGVRFANALMRHLTQTGRSLCGGIGTDNAFAYRSALKLGLHPFRQSWTALLAEPMA